MVDALVHGIGFVQVGAWSMHLFMVHVYNSISHSDSVTVVPSFYLYVRVVG
jgi:hypothetical protein